MIDFQYDITIPANTLESEPYVQDIKLTKGELVKVVLIFQLGCAYMVHVALSQADRQVMPIIEGMSYALDGYTLVRDTAIQLIDHPYELRFKGWSEGTTYEHTIGIIATVKTEKDTTQMAELLALLS